MHTTKGLKIGFGAAATVLALSSTAMACTVYRGKLTVTGTNGVAASLIGNNSGMGYCGGFAPGGATGSAGSQVHLHTEQATCGGATHALPDTTTRAYDVNFINGKAFVKRGKNWWFNIDCMTASGANEVKIGEMTVTGGVGDGFYNLPSGPLSANTIDDRSALCVSGFGTNWNLYGNQVPISVV